MNIPNTETLALLISCLAIIVSLVVWFGQRKLQKESNDLQRATSKLAKKQLEILNRGPEQKSKLRLDLIEHGRNGYKFYITNVSNVDALEVDLELILHNQNSNPLITSEVNEKLPMPKLSPGSKLSLMASLTLESPETFPAILKWKNPNGENVREQVNASL